VLGFIINILYADVALNKPGINKLLAGCIDTCVITRPLGKKSVFRVVRFYGFNHLNTQNGSDQQLS
jgi:hypothetical protein